MTRRRPTPTRTLRVAGEDPQVLLPLLARATDSLVPNDTGSYDFHVVYGRDEAPPLLRALMRVEAELLLADAQRLDGPEASWRDHDARAADAFVLLALRTSAALGGLVDRQAVRRLVAGRHLPTPSGVA